MGDGVADDLADIKALQQQRGPQCQAGLILAAIDPSIRASVVAALADPTIERSAIYRWLTDRKGITISRSSFERHTAGECRCG